MLAAWIGVALLVIFLVYCFFSSCSPSPCEILQEGFGQKEVDQCYVINLDKDTERYDAYMARWNASDMADSIPVARFPGIVGRDVSEPEKLLTPKAWDELLAVEKKGSRTHHYQLSRGGIGCFISHLAVMKRLTESSSAAYLIMEDDNHCFPVSKALMTASLKEAPSDWDIICGVVHRADGTDVGPRFREVTGFWGLGGYLVTRNGAQKILDEVQARKMDGQIDAFLSRMAQQGKIKIYSVKEPWFENTSIDSNIQYILDPSPGQDPFMFDGYLV
jgi:GR25 family glycosyltransferase involved in LPS biosynthesis